MAIGEPEFYMAAEALLHDWDALMKWHRSRTLESLAKYELKARGKLDIEC